ncbi:MAG: HAMP domain-containing histidine kinase [Betaproteobacteria bacterium]|nr:HAMP domain-containing histidine kinase [Betaproteobacteria bacterium]
MALKGLSGVLLVKLFSPGKTIVWSTEPQLVGTKLTSHAEHLDRAMMGEVQAMFNAADRSLNDVEKLPHTPLIEFYVPFSLVASGAEGDKVNGVFALYRSPQELNDTINHGRLLLWLVTGLGGVILFVSLNRLFKSVYHRQREAESRFIKLSAEHERIMRVEKLSALGQMVSEIAHQLNNPLVGVVNLAELAEHEADNPERVRELLGNVRRAGEDCREFVQRMLQFNEVSRFEPKPTDMNELTRETIIFFQQSMAGHPDVTLAAPDHPLMLDADPVLMRHALFNLIHNAALSEPKGPVVVSLAHDDSKDVPGCRIAVSDRGSGIKPEVAARLFTPFFTTRSGGTGLGLSVTQHIVAQHGGSIHAGNNPGGGARFVIWLPASR